MSSAGAQVLTGSDAMLPQLALFVDPDVQARRLYRTPFITQRFVVEEASDGHEALAKALNDPPDVIVTETRLDGLDGFRLCERLRAEKITKAIPIVVLTADDRPTEHHRARQAGADLVLVKPCLPEVLLDYVRLVRQHSAALRARALALHATVKDRINTSAALIAKSVGYPLSRSSKRRAIAPALTPPELLCPSCARQTLRHDRSVNDANDADQVDVFCCPDGCGTFQFSHRAQKLTIATSSSMMSLLASRH